MENPLHMTVSMVPSRIKRSLDLRDMMDELPMLATLKDHKWMDRLPRNLFPKLKKNSPKAVSDTDNTLLSPEFLPSPWTARAMSVLIPQPTDDVLEALDARFFTESFDSVAYMLENLPESKNKMNAFMRTEISAVDVAKDAILTKLQDEVRANYSSLIQGMKVVQEVDLDLVRAQIQVKNGRRLLATTKNDLVLSSLDIVKTKRNRDHVSEIVRIGLQIVQLFDEEEKMKVALQEHHFIVAVDICISLRKGLSHDALQGLTILKEFRFRINDFIPRLRELFDQSLRKVAAHFDPLKYKELLQAYITLADHSENHGFEFSSYTLTEVLSSIPEIIVRSIDDMKTEFIRQVVEGVSPETTKSERKINQIAQNNTSRNDEYADVALTPAFQTVERIKRCYEHLADLMHNYYLLVQWHRDPFNPLNDDIAYLHRCGIDDDDDDDEDSDSDKDSDYHEKECHHSYSSKKHPASNEFKEPESSSHHLRNSGLNDSNSRRSRYDQVLCDTGMTLLKYRKIVWENMQQNVLEMIEKLDTSYGYQMEHIIALSLATTTYNKIGEEFAGAPSSDIWSVLRVKCEQYLHAFHDDNIELARMLLDTENWLRVTIPSTDGDDKAIHLVLPIRWKWLPMKQGIRFHHKTTGSENYGNKTSPPEYHNQRLPVTDPNEPELVLTSSSLAGFVRLCGVYLKMMEHLPHISWDVLRLLNCLFEFNLYVVFTNFIAPDDIAQFFDRMRGILLQSSWICPSATDGNMDQQQNSPMSRKVNLRKVIRTPSAVEESNSYALAERLIACEVVVGQSRLLHAIKELARSYLPDRYLCLMDEMYERNHAVARELRSFMHSTIARRLVDIPALLESVFAVSWDITYISDQRNEYIVHLVQKCGEVWKGLQVLADGSIPIDAREDMWAAMVQTIMDTLLQAFSTAPNPTPQGRALMLLDLHALLNGLDQINYISSRAVPCGREHVSNYIKAFYYDEYELLEWVQDNKTLYSKVLFANLLKNGIGLTLEIKKLRELVLEIDTIIG
ncbi:unnamed protein product [Peronospora destructor]|uniref:Exocyst complex component Sec8 n=1 Tax=Peronospora destructor TaxID=86335 RepID=A0AAV0V635_9STRA|nr:unnamed protein product [Peronospora destructor]